jgi:hypothetical protein
MLKLGGCTLKTVRVIPAQKKLCALDLKPFELLRVFGNKFINGVHDNLSSLYSAVFRFAGIHR